MRKKVVAAACTAATVLTVTGVAQAQELNAIPDVVRTLDGSGNNVAHPTWGKTNTQYLRVAPANYADGIKKPVAGPPTRRVSNRIFNDTNQNLFSENGVTQWGFTWGQFLDHTFGLREENGGESAPIAFAANDPLESFTNTLGGGSTMAFTRTPAAPGTGAGSSCASRSTPSAATSTRSAVYGRTNTRLEWLREGPVDGNLANNGAKLLLAPDGTLPRRTARGNAATAPEMGLHGRASQPRPARRWWPVTCGRTRTWPSRPPTRCSPRSTTGSSTRSHAALGEEARFQIARRVVGAEQQFITYNEFLPSLGLSAVVVQRLQAERQREASATSSRSPATGRTA